ncbi:pseudouridine synthase [Plectonema radiosum]|nr:pseudouridine synthase [Plectonema radiosum]
MESNDQINNSPATYYYQGYSDGKLLKLPRTLEAEAIAIRLMQQLGTNPIYSREGKMYGILLVKLPNGEKRILKAFSGLLNGCSLVEGWVPSIPGREQVVLEETRTLAELEVIKQEIIQLKQLAQRKEYKTIALQFEQALQDMSKRHQVNKQQRQEKRQLLYKTLMGQELNQLNIELEKLNESSRRDGIERKILKQQQDQVLQPLQMVINRADIQIRELKQQRKQISRKLQAQMHAAYSIMNFLGNSSTLQQLMPQGLPTGTGDCCAVKLLHYAATNNLQPLAIAEFWWGESNQDKIQGEFYGACIERCQPLMGFLLSGLQSNSQVRRREVPIIYEDEWLIAVNKPAGLLSVPGRYHYNQDSVLSRLINLCPNGENITAVHRLDMDTSGILLLAKDQETHGLLSKQFEQRLVKKVYEAVLSGNLLKNKGTIELPLWGNPEHRPYQEVNYKYGKSCITKFQVLNKEENRSISICQKHLVVGASCSLDVDNEQDAPNINQDSEQDARTTNLNIWDAPEDNYTRIEFMPLTGRTHQLRVHAADAKGLGIPILGDKFYGCEFRKATRLHLHARELTFEHPHLREMIYLKAETPF